MTKVSRHAAQAHQNIACHPIHEIEGGIKQNAIKNKMPAQHSKSHQKCTDEPRNEIPNQRSDKGF